MALFQMELALITLTAGQSSLCCVLPQGGTEEDFSMHEVAMKQARINCEAEIHASTILDMPTWYLQKDLSSFMRIKLSPFSCSQPPLLSEMLRVVHEAIGDKAFLAEQFPYLQQEYEYWTQSPRQVKVLKNGISYSLSRYWSTRYTPRPESYRYELLRALTSFESFTGAFASCKASSAGYDIV